MVALTGLAIMLLGLVLLAGARLGVLLAPAEPVSAIAEDLPHLALVALVFPAFNDGRSFSKAELLRSRAEVFDVAAVHRIERAIDHRHTLAVILKLIETNHHGVKQGRSRGS